MGFPGFGDAAALRIELPARDRSGVTLVRSAGDSDRDASVLPLAVPAFDPEALDAPSPDPRSAGWQPFQAAFDVVQTSDDLDVSSSWLGLDDGVLDDKDETATSETRDLLLATTLTQVRRRAQGVLAGLAERVRGVVSPRPPSVDIPALPDWAIARLADEPETGTVPALPDWAIERLAMRDETGTIVPLPGWAIARLRGDDTGVEVLPLPDWAIGELVEGDPDGLPFLPEAAVLHLATAAAFRRTALLAAGGAAVAVTGLLSLAISQL